jgi:hypothetical protein
VCLEYTLWMNFLSLCQHFEDILFLCSAKILRYTYHYLFCHAFKPVNVHFLCKTKLTVITSNCHGHINTKCRLCIGCRYRCQEPGPVWVMLGLCHHRTGLLSSVKIVIRIELFLYFWYIRFAVICSGWIVRVHQLRWATWPLSPAGDVMHPQSSSMWRLWRLPGKVENIVL